VNVVYQHSSGDIWVGTAGGLNRYDGTHWSTFKRADGLANDRVVAIFEDASGHLWFLGRPGLTRYDGSTWTAYSAQDGLVNEDVRAIVQDARGVFWLATAAGVSRYEPDRVPPRTVITPQPPAVNASRQITLTYAAGFQEMSGVQFSYSLDAAPWSSWSATSFYIGAGLSDGEHRFQVRARDPSGNVDPMPAGVRFEVDASPPAPVVVSPVFNQVVRGTVSIVGTAADARFSGYSVRVRRAPTGPERVLRYDVRPVEAGELARWDTRESPDGIHDLVVQVVDSLGLSGEARISVVVDNDSPGSEQTSPVVVAAASGGDVYTTFAEAHLYIPPHSFARDALVALALLDTTRVPAVLESGAVRVLPGVQVSWSQSLSKPVVLELSLADVDVSPGSDELSVYQETDSGWQRLGGTVDAERRSVSISTREAGRYAVFRGRQSSGGGASVSALSLSPRVVSPRDAGGGSSLNIAFVLGQQGPVSVRIFARNGRLVREVLSGSVLEAGSNVVRWDGRTRDGGMVLDGLYLVSVEAQGERRTATVAVVR
jgi:hypothetical protein